MKTLLPTTLLLFALSMPRAAFAQPTFRDFVLEAVRLIDLATIALVSLAILVFFWSVISNLWGYDGGNAEQKKKLQDTLLWGLIIIFVMVSIWGIIRILQQTLANGL